MPRSRLTIFAVLACLVGACIEPPPYPKIIPRADADTDTAAKVEVDTSPDIKPDADTVAEVDADTAAEVDADTVAEIDADTVAEVDADTAAEVDSDTAAEVDADTAAQVDADAPAEVDAGTAAEIDVDTPAEVDADTTPDIEVDTATDTDTDTDTGPDVVPPCLTAADCAPSGPCQGPPSCDPFGAGCTYEALTGTPCDDGDPCTVPDLCEAGVCKTGPKDCSGFKGVCLIGLCNPANGACSSEAATDGTPCDDAKPCTVGDMCTAAKCVSGQPKNCSDFNACTLDSCEPVSGACAHEDAEFAADCSDGDLCTASDGCQAGQCVGYPTKPMEVEWWTRIGGPGTQYPPRVLVHEDDSMTLVGITDGDWEVGVQPQPPFWPVASPDLDIALVRLNPSGGVAWSRPLGGADWDIPFASAAGVNGSFHFAASMSPDANLGSKGAPFMPSDLAPDLTMVLATFDQSGDLKWAAGLEGPGAFEAVAALPAGGVRALIIHREQVTVIDASGQSPVVLPVDWTDRDSVWLADFDAAGTLTKHARVLFLPGPGYQPLNSRPILVVDSSGATYILHLGWEQVEWGEGAQATGYNFGPGTGAALIRVLSDFSIGWGVVVGFPQGAELGRGLSMVPTSDGVAIAATSAAGGFVLSNLGGGLHSVYPEETPPSGKVVLLAFLTSSGAISGSLGAVRAVRVGLWQEGDGVAIALSSNALTDGAVFLNGGLKTTAGVVPLSAGTTTIDVVTVSPTGQIVGMQPLSAPYDTFLRKLGADSLLALTSSPGVVKATGPGLSLPPADGVDSYIVKLGQQPGQSCP